MKRYREFALVMALGAAALGQAALSQDSPSSDSPSQGQWTVD